MLHAFCTLLAVANENFACTRVVPSLLLREIKLRNRILCFLHEFYCYTVHVVILQ